MGATATQTPPLSSIEPSNNNITCVKVLAESCNLKSFNIPSHFNFTNDPNKASTAVDSLPTISLPTIDFSMLTSSDPHQRSTVLHDLVKACQEWGIFVVVNHGIPETLLKATLDASLEFFELPDEEKQLYEAKSLSDPINSGSGRLIDTANQTVHLWRDYLKCYVHPQFHCPQKPLTLRDILLEFSERSRLVIRTLIQGIGENLGLEEGYIDQALELDSSFELFAANFYPLCPQPEQAIGLPTHTDPGLFTSLIHNGVPGLQIQHDGNWFNVDSPQHSLMVNVADQLQIFSNGRCKSVKHRAVVNSERERISVVVAYGPSEEAVVGPAAPLVLKDGRSLYRPMKYTDFMESMYTRCRLNGESILEQLMIQEDEDKLPN